MSEGTGKDVTGTHPVEGGPVSDTAPVARTSQVLAAPSHHAVLDAVLELSRTVTVDMHADEVVHSYVDTFKNLFPHRMFCVRLFDPETGEVAMVYATGRLRQDRRSAVEITEQAMYRHGVDMQASDVEGLDVVEQYRSHFDGGERGFDVPMRGSQGILGILCAEYPQGAQVPEDDEPLIVQLTLQLGSALRNSRLHRESVYLRDYLSKLLDNANAPIMVMGRHGQISFANRAFLAITGFKRDEVLGQDWLSLMRESERSRLLPIYINALRGEPTSNVEVKLPRRDGTVAHVAVNTASILSPDGDVEGVIYIYRDISEIRDLEEQIIHAEKLATLGQLAAGVVHELNNPLTSISAYADYLKRKYTNANGDIGDIQKLDRIVEGADRILNFTRDLVSYARPSAEQPVLVNIVDVVDQAVVFCEHLIDETGTTVEKNYAEDVPHMYGVKGRLVQVFVNLVTNACHAMPLGAGKLVIGSSDRPGGLLCVSFTDSGKGIPEDNLDRIFEPFFSTKGEGKGTGLGLSIVKNIIEQHRGEILVTSEVGTGTTFEVILPCRQEPRDPA